MIDGGFAIDGVENVCNENHVQHLFQITTLRMICAAI